MEQLIRRMSPHQADEQAQERLLTSEWLVTNGLGGYAAGTVAGVATRRYHGLLIAAMPAPLGRMLVLGHLSELIRWNDGRTIRLGGEELAPADLHLHGAEYLAEFRLEMGLPVWRFESDGLVLEKRLLMPHEQNTVHVTYRLLAARGPIRLKLLPSMHLRSHDAPVSTPLPAPFKLHACQDRYEISAGDGLPTVRMCVHGERTAFTVEGRIIPEWLYRIEESRGYESTGNLWSPGYFRVDVPPGGEATLVASTENWETMYALKPQEVLAAECERRRRLLEAAPSAARTGMGAELVLAADQFIITPVGRAGDAARMHAEGDEPRTVIAGYHWFTDWGRDTMISLEGLTLATGRTTEAGYILRTFAHFIRDGLIPNLFPEGQEQGLYHTADATLWFFHALERYLQVTGDRALVRGLIPKLIDVVEHHLRGTRFGICVDPRDGLVRQGAPGYQLTWMDAKVGDWVVTPRRGKAVEINALWYNALSLLEGWLRAEDDEGAAERIAGYAARAYDSFNERFWYGEGGHLYDVVDGETGDDPACRPNQLFAVSLPYAVLDPGRWEQVLNVVAESLLTPVGLRSLASGHPDYKRVYFGDLRARDAAYHQGTVWSWLIGPFIDAWLRVHPGEPSRARRFLEGFERHLGQACIGSVSEIFDADPPYTPRGCVAQAWGVAEALRCWVKTAPDPPATD
jgi:predicted glycogen debranching enzyme